MIKKKPRVLHITEALGGGVTSALITYAANSPAFEHHISAISRDADNTGEEATLSTHFESVNIHQRNVASILSLYRDYKRIQPEIVHLHSTYAGVYIRALTTIPSSKIVYTPHGFAFLRNDKKPALLAYKIIEKILTLRTSRILACSRNEFNLSKNVLSQTKTREIINIAQLPPDSVIIPSSLKSRVECIYNGKKSICMAGRISQQKGYTFFAQVSEKLKGEFNFIWIGGGDPAGIKILEEAGVTVTGWIPRNDVLSLITEADLYFHSAAWDGFPIVVLEAAALDKPVLLRQISPFSDEGLSTCSTPDEAAERISIHFSKNTEQSKAEFNTSHIRNTHTPSRLSELLESAYNEVINKNA